MADIEVDSLYRLTVPELQQELKKRGLKKSGVKAKLIQRLFEHIQKHGLELDDNDTALVGLQKKVKESRKVTEQPPVEELNLPEQPVINNDNREVESDDVTTGNLVPQSTESEADDSIAIDSGIDRDVEITKVIHEEQTQSEDADGRIVNVHLESDSDASQQNNISQTSETLPDESNKSDVTNAEEVSVADVLHHPEDTHADETMMESETQQRIDGKENIVESEKTKEGKCDEAEVSLMDEGEIVSDNDCTANQENEEVVTKIKKQVTPVPLKKQRLSLQGSEGSVEEKVAKRKRRWGLTHTSLPTTAESIQKLIPEVKIDVSIIEGAPELDYQEDDKEANHRAESNSNVVGRKVKLDSGKKVVLSKRVEPPVVIDSMPDEPVSSKPRLSVSFDVDDDGEVQGNRDRSPSPATNPVCRHIHIENLVRPFTVNQLKRLISRTGTIAQDGFWINNIKSHCYVQLSSNEEAVATRQAIHGLKWPPGTPKCLNVDYAVTSQMWKETQCMMGEETKVVIEIDDKEEEKKPDEIERSHKKKKEKENDKPKPKREKPREESPAKLLDDLFRKTTATPCIYWLPLTEEQILLKERNAITKVDKPRTAPTRFSPERRPSRRSRSPIRHRRGWR